MGYSVDCRAPGSPLFLSPQLSLLAVSNPSEPPSSSSCIFCLAPRGGWDDPLQCFLPSPFSFASLSSLLPAAQLSSSAPSTSSTYCLASVSVAKSIRRRGGRLGAAGRAPGPAEGLSSALRFVLKGKAKKTTEQSNTALLTREEAEKEHKVDTHRLDAKCKNEPSQALTTSKHLLAGAMSAVISRTLVAPLERLKLEYIVRGATSDVGDVVRKIITSEGLKGFWKGNLVNLIRTAPFKSINFYTYDLIRKRITAISGRKEVTNFEKLAAGAAAGIFATVVCFPMDTIRTRMVAPGGEALGGIAGCFRHMISSQGLSSLYAGLLPAIISMAPAGAVFYGVYDILKSGYIESPAGQEELRRRTSCDQMQLGPLRTLLYGAIAGACAETVTYPLEVVRRHLQMQNAANRLGLIHTVQALVHEKGVGGLYAGLLPSTLQVLPSAALSYFVYEWLKLSMKVS